MTTTTTQLADTDEHPTSRVQARCTFQGCRHVETIPLLPRCTVAEARQIGSDARTAHFRAVHLAAAQAVYDAGDGAPRS